MDQINIIKIKKNELDELIRNIYWQDLVINPLKQNGNSTSYSFSFPSVILEKIEEIKSLFTSMVHLKDVGEEILFGNSAEEFTWKIQIDIYSRRIHMPGNGIPISIRKLGLSVKTYRAILEHVPFVSSEDFELTDHGKMIWYSLRKNTLFYTFYRENKGFCFSSDKDPLEILNILEDQINPENFDEILWDENFVNENKVLIEKSKLSKLLLS